MPNIKAAMALAVMVLVVALLFPTMISAADSSQQQYVELAQGESTNVTDRLTVAADTVYPASDNATVTVSSSQTLNESQQLLNDTETKSYVVDGYETNVTLEDSFVSDDGQDTARLKIVYTPYFGWDSGAQLFFENLGLLFAIVGGIMVLGLAGIASKW